MNKAFRYLSACILLGISNHILATQEGQLAPPEVNVIDEFGVNLATGQVTAKTDTVSIGGDLGLKHSVSFKANNFDHIAGYGYVDGFAGNAKYVNVGKGVAFTNSGSGRPNEYYYAMRVFSPLGTHDFWVYVDGQLDFSAHDVTSGYEYRSLGDTRNTLTVEGKYLVWTTPEGVKSRFERGGPNVPAHADGKLVDITYPNGFKVRTSRGGVTTNTGFQLKYHFDSSAWGGLSSQKQAIYDSLPANNQVTDSESWFRNPHKIIGINRAHEYCSINPSVSCRQSDWPTATFNWPGGMPVAFYLGSSVVSVENARGGTTEYHYQAFDVCTKSGEHLDECIWDADVAWSPRLIGIKGPSTEKTGDYFDFKYEYQNSVSYKHFAGQTFSFLGLRGSWEGRINKASKQSVISGYSNPAMSQLYPAGPHYYQVNSHADRVEINGDIPGRLITVNTKENGLFIFEQTYRNFVIASRQRSKPTKYYWYDDRGNLEKVVTSNDHLRAVPLPSHYPQSCGSTDQECFVEEAEYPDTCDYALTCNKPLWTKDARGNLTHYEYDPQGRHGNPIKITEPTDRNGKRKTTVYHYDPMHAYYKRNSNTIEQDPDPIWLLTREHTCRTSTATETGWVVKAATMTWLKPSTTTALKTVQPTTCSSGEKASRRKATQTHCKPA